MDCTGRLHLFPECAKCARLLPVTGPRTVVPIIPEIRVEQGGRWVCLNYREKKDA